MDWTFFPRVRNGLELADLRDNVAAFDSAKALLNCGLSDSGAKIAANIRRLDPREDRGGGVRLGPDRYAISIFGQPSSDARWGWRVEGHHLTLNWTIDGGRVVSVTPMAFGISPFVDQAGEPQALGGDQQAYLDFLGTLDATPERRRSETDPCLGRCRVWASRVQQRGTGSGFGSRIVEATQAAAWKVLDTVYDRLDSELAWIRRAPLVLKPKTFSSVGGDRRLFVPTHRIEGRDFTFDFVNAGRGQPRAHALPGGGATLVKRSKLDSVARVFPKAPCGPLRAPCCFQHAFDGSAGHIVSLNSREAATVVVFTEGRERIDV